MKDVVIFFSDQWPRHSSSRLSKKSSRLCHSQFKKAHEKARSAHQTREVARSLKKLAPLAKLTWSTCSKSIVLPIGVESMSASSNHYIEDITWPRGETKFIFSC